MLKRQMYGIFIIALFVPILAVGSFLIYNNYSTLYDHHHEMLVSDNLRIRSILFEVTTSITNVCDVIAESDMMASFITTQYESTEEAAQALESFTLLQRLYSRYTEISSLKLYTDNDTLYSYLNVEVVDDTNREWFEALISRPGYYWTTNIVTSKYGITYDELQLVHPVNLPGSEIDALLVIKISNNYLKNRIENNQLDVDITVNHDPIFFSSWGNTNKVIDYDNYYKEAFYSDSGIRTLFGRESLAEISAIKPIKAEDSIYIFSTDPEAMARIQRLQSIAILIVLISLIVPTYVIIRFTRQLSNRVNTLRREMHRVTDGDYNVIETFVGNDELVDLFQDLKVMIHSIKERDELIYVSKIKEQQLIGYQKEIELELLASKINPHFLYNTLETIRMKAVTSDNYEVADAVKLLGRYMRYNLESTGEMTTLFSELEYITVYLSIQKLRFTDRIDFTIHLEDTIDARGVHMMPLLIQPLVENALLHGHEETLEGGVIKVSCHDEGQWVKICVSNNGAGMDEATLDRVRYQIDHKLKSEHKSIGLYNIQQRLKLTYGEEAGLHIESEIGKGTRVTFKVPKA